MRALGALLMVCALSTVASAEETPQQKADRLFSEGRELLTVKNDAKAACERFEAAIKLDATATGTMLNLGLCYENLGKYATSIRWFRKAQAAAAENKLTEYENAAKEHTVTISPKVPVLKVAVVGPPEAEITIDGVRIDATEYGRVEVDPGTHELAGRAPGMRRVTKTIDIKESQTETVEITINEVAVPVYVDKGKRRRVVGLGLAGGGAVALGVSLALNLKWRGDQEATKDDPTDVEHEKLNDKMRIYGTSVFAVGAAMVVTGAVLYFTAPGKEQISDGTAWAPVVSPDQVGFAVSGSF